ncbi:unnamed protein product [Rotaria sordida]|uniref:Uncharacterized protein n=1 Tax=Rotaria sordida TaxID=392033 RepID=A0A813TUQ2_9BILA|nr:unnamed protein product [Rotaria sordida]CAF0914291.1 unnamed protein product [Rotaria sordida]CAF3658720.1 unnamed protein product [Rotaria sordida]CAF3887798.1 unnamed protein product [Rotaria sordida]
MSYPLQPYKPNNGALVDQQFNRAIPNGYNGGGNDWIGSLFGFASRLMGEILRNDPDIGGISALMGSNPCNPYGKVFGISAMNVTQISPGLDGRPHVVQAHDERRIGPGGIWQTKKALRDPGRGIDKMQLGYFAGDRAEIIQRRLDPYTGQYQQEIQRRGIPTNGPNLSHHRQMQSQPTIQQTPRLQPQQYQYYPQQQQQQQLPPYSQQPQLPFHTQQPQQALPAPSRYQYL